MRLLRPSRRPTGRRPTPHGRVAKPRPCRRRAGPKRPRPGLGRRRRLRLAPGPVETATAPAFRQPGRGPQAEAGTGAIPDIERPLPISGLAAAGPSVPVLPAYAVTPRTQGPGRPTRLGLVVPRQGAEVVVLPTQGRRRLTARAVGRALVAVGAPMDVARRLHAGPRPARPGLRLRPGALAGTSPLGVALGIGQGILVLVGDGLATRAATVLAVAAPEPGRLARAATRALGLLGVAQVGPVPT